MTARLLEFLRAGRKGDAIKLHRRATQSSHAESKACVDSLIQRYGLPDTGRGGCLPALALLLTGMAAAVIAAMATASFLGLVA